MERISLKIVGAQGQGINSIGEIVAKGLKRKGYCVFGYREYMSLIKGGHSSYQLDVGADSIESTETHVDVLLTVNHHGLEQNLREVKPRGIVIHYVPDWAFSKADATFLRKNRITVLCLPVKEILEKVRAKPVLGNIILTAYLWSILGQSAKALMAMVSEQFGHKGKEVIDLNFRCIEEAIAHHQRHARRIRLNLPKPRTVWKDHMLITGSQAMGLGLVHAGCRMYVGYPMTPSSPLLSYIADLQNETGMVIKQAEDEITAAQMMSGAMFMGTRAATGTSGGGFDLMTETVSLNGMIENPSLFVLAQRPGPATGLPTWTAQGDLLLAVGSAHGEFPRLVVAVSSAADSFFLMGQAFNLAEEFQIPVILLTDKQIAEALFTQAPFDHRKIKLRRGLVTDPKALRRLKGAGRYDPGASDGVSPRWLPGMKAETYCAQGDEHSPDGTVDETSTNANRQMEKRMRKMQALKRTLPEPELYMSGDRGAPLPFPLPKGEGIPMLDLLIVSWGSNRGVILDVMRALGRGRGMKGMAGKKVGYLHYTYLWPLKTEKFERLARSVKRVVLVECNHQGQLGMLLRMATGIEVPEKILKTDGRPFFFNELLSRLRTLL